MKKLFTLLVALFALISCSTTRYISVNSPQAEANALQILQLKYPDLVPYYNEGVLQIMSYEEIPVTTGYDYDINYRFVRYYYNNLDERIACLRTRYPDIYNLYMSGVIEITSFYKYVDKRTMEICYYINYRHTHGYRYNRVMSPVYPYGRWNYYYPRPIPPRPRVAPAPRPKPRPNVGPNHRPNNNPRPTIRPNNQQPRQQPATRPNSAPRQQPSTRPSSRPSSQRSGSVSSHSGRSSSAGRSSSSSNGRRR